MDKFTARNTTTFCLDGTAFNVLNSYLKAMKDLDEWFRDGTPVVDAACLFGPGHDIVRTREGIFYLVIEYQGNSLKVPIDGHNLYVRGFSNMHGNFELDFGKDAKFQHAEGFTVLDIGVNYHDILDDSLENTLTGLWRMRKSVGKLCNFKGGTAKPIGPQVGAIAVHISEAARSAAVHSFICRSIVDKGLSTLDKGKGLVIWIKKHKSLSTQLLKNIDRLYQGKVPHPINSYGLDLTLQDLLVGLRVCPKDSYNGGVFHIKENKSGLRGSRRGLHEIRGKGLLPHIQRGLFGTRSSGISQTKLENLPIELAALRECKEDVEMLLPLTSPITKVREWSIDGAISHAKFDDAKPLLEKLPMELAAQRECKEDVEMLLPLTSPITKVRNWSVDGAISHAKFDDAKPLAKMHFDRRAMIKSRADLAFRQMDYAQPIKFYNMAKMHLDRTRAMIKSQADLAFRQKDYARAIKFYNMDKKHSEKKRAMIKSQAELAFRQKDYALPLKFYDMGIDIAPEARLYSNRSLCKLRTGDGEGALSDAYKCRMMRPAGQKALLDPYQGRMMRPAGKKAIPDAYQCRMMRPAEQKLAIGKQLLTCYARTTSKHIWSHKNWILAMMKLRRS